MPFEIEEGSGRVRLHGRWTVAEAAALGPGLEALQPRNAGKFVLDAAGIEALDLTRAWLLRATEARLRAAGVVASAGGIAVSFRYDLPTGPLIVVMFGVLLTLALVGRKLAGGKPNPAAGSGRPAEE